MTGKKASVSKVYRSNGDSRPNFILFVVAIAKEAANHEPTLSEVASAFRTLNVAGKKATQQPSNKLLKSS
jgi:hypothetical protein